MRYRCDPQNRYANEEDFFTAVLESLTDSGTAMVTYEGFEEQDEVRYVAS
jgi:hypothetical protein